jgi:hypothetical protein
MSEKIRFTPEHPEHEEDAQPEVVPLEVIPAEDLRTKNCIVISEGGIHSIGEITEMAVSNEAFIDNSDDEAGDDLYAVQFPDHKQELLTNDGIRGRIRELIRKEDGEEGGE